MTTTVTGVDAYGNDLGELTDLAVIDTGDASDGVTAGEIRFGHWGSRTVTASVGSASDDQALTVWPVTSDYVLSASPDSLLVGDEVQLTVMLGGESGADVTSEFDFTAAATGATVDGDAVMFTQPGTHTVVATHRDTGVELEVDVSATLDRTSPADITLSMSANTVDEGESLSFGVTGTDRFGNDLGNLSDLASVTSSHATDLIDPDGTIYFPTASEHTITAVIGQATASAVVTVAPATVPAQDNPRDAGQAGLSSTGVDGAIWAVGAIALLALGLGVFLLVRRKSGSDAGTDT